MHVSGWVFTSVLTSLGTDLQSFCKTNGEYISGNVDILHCSLGKYWQWNAEVTGNNGERLKKEAVKKDMANGGGRGAANWKRRRERKGKGEEK